LLTCKPPRLLVKNEIKSKPGIANSSQLKGIFVSSCARRRL
jgi:hypothetical protein